MWYRSDTQRLYHTNPWQLSHNSPDNNESVRSSEPAQTHLVWRLDFSSGRLRLTPVNDRATTTMTKKLIELESPNSENWKSESAQDGSAASRLSRWTAVRPSLVDNGRRRVKPVERFSKGRFRVRSYALNVKQCLLLHLVHRPVSLQRRSGHGRY